MVIHGKQLADRGRTDYTLFFDWNSQLNPVVKEIIAIANENQVKQQKTQ